jgi:predicted Zn-dependent protease
MTTPPPRLENRLPDEGINSSDEHPLKEFAWLIGGTLVTLAVVIVLVGWGAGWLAPKLPFRYEVALAQKVLDGPEKPEDARRSKALQALADRVAAKMDLPPGMTVLLRYEDGAMVNAYATIGGRVRVYRGLLSQIESEDALAALLAHEIAHVKHRHVAASMGRGLALSMLLAVVSTDAGAAAASGALSQATGIALLGYTREHETQSDDEAIEAIVALYGHAGGFERLFAVLSEAEARRGGGAGGGPALEVLRSHPLTPKRIEHARQVAAAKGYASSGPPTPMPVELVVERPKAKAP